VSRFVITGCVDSSLTQTHLLLVDDIARTTTRQCDIYGRLIVTVPEIIVLRDGREECQEKVDAEGNILVTSSDYLFGRVQDTKGHPGNMRFENIVTEYRIDYFLATESRKPHVARAVDHALRNSGSRFLRKDDETGLWYPVGVETTQSFVHQVLRDYRSDPKARYYEKIVLGGERQVYFERKERTENVDVRNTVPKRAHGDSDDEGHPNKLPKVTTWTEY
jgi:hypothetical protein